MEPYTDLELFDIDKIYTGICTREHEIAPYLIWVLKDEEA
jgi:hypothetical protein